MYVGSVGWFSVPLRVPNDVNLFAVAMSYGLVAASQFGIFHDLESSPRAFGIAANMRGFASSNAARVGIGHTVDRGASTSIFG